MTPSRTNWWAITALCLGVFAMVTIEQIPIGILTLLTAEFGVTEGIAGLTVTVPGYLAALASLVAPIAARRLDRKIVLLGALAAMTMGAIASALAPNFLALMAARIVIGLSIGTFWSIAPTMAVRLARPEDIARATTIVFAGVSLGAVGGVPIGTFLGTTFNWQISFLALAAFGMLTGVLLLVKCPRTIPRSASTAVKDLLQVAQQPLVAAGLLLTACLVGSTLCAATYASPLLQQQAQVPEQSIGGYLFLMGAAGLVGNFFISAVVQRSAFFAALTMSASIALVFLGLVPFATNPTSAAVIIALWGLVTGTLSAGCQGWINQTTGATHDIATGLSAAMFNIAIASGAGAGGLIVDYVGISWVPICAGVGALCGAIPVIVYRVHRRHAQHS